LGKPRSIPGIMAGNVWEALSVMGQNTQAVPGLEFFGCPGSPGLFGSIVDRHKSGCGNFVSREDYASRCCPKFGAAIGVNAWDYTWDLESTRWIGLAFYG
jgi:hypothetical protein